ncbi:hypothetical protein ABL78_6813 [Leptomonas seymouri]|uniref:Uncharacterized protein n=1 Tax=Leptomonas seymouri TaxID=5684 RepID=A0A0N0P3H6_LEPSE|nr:hypothetical protein ABL78_6813 [Leptomonas seymouri]|eukprot:KPI84139.1 hypothetical protein ABL78_6813 [Leptomonas seymouri]
MAEAVEDDVRLMSHEERVASYRELVEGLEGILASHEPDGAGDNEDEDAEQLALIEEVEMQLRTLAKLLNEEERIQVTPGLMKKVDRSATTGELETTILYPPPPSHNGGNPANPAAGAPYEVLFDERDWYPCVITGIVTPENEVDRIQYKAWILGHNVEEVVYSEALRPWQPSPTAAEELQGGASCHVIHPRTGRYVEGLVDRLTLERTVFVKVPAGEKEKWAEPAGDAAASETISVPLSHVRTGKLYAQLRRRPKNDEERAARRAEQTKLKRQRAAQKRLHVAEQLAKEAGDWQSLMGDMMGLGQGGGAKKKKRRLN